ncbi:MAG: GxxExxY protein, partial [Flavitalea sp.]
IIEIKAVETLNDIHLAQVLTYLKLTGVKLGLLMNFNVVRLKDGIRRVVNNFNRKGRKVNRGVSQRKSYNSRKKNINVQELLLQ